VPGSTYTSPDLHTQFRKLAFSKSRLAGQNPVWDLAVIEKNKSNKELRRYVILRWNMAVDSFLLNISNEL
jgi:hypothetical protein